MKSKRSATKKRGPVRVSQAQREELAMEFRRLRSLFQEVVDAYMVRVSATIQRLAEHFEETDIVQSDPDSGLSVEQCERIFSSIRRLDVKPKNARRRDLKRIEELAAEIEETINR